MSNVDILYQITKLKETDYKNILLLTSLVEILIEKGIFTRDELLEKVKQVDDIAVVYGDSPHKQL